MSTPSVLFASFLSAVSLGAVAQPGAQAPSVYIQSGVANGGIHIVTLGGTLPWGDWQKPLGSGLLTGHWDAYLSHWRYNGVNRNNLVLLGLTPTLRWTPDGGASPWFFQGGIGVTLSNHLYHSSEHQFSTAFNFASHIGVGLRWGEQRRHEVLLSLQHISNARIKSPNPGRNLVHLRYALHW